MVRRNRMSYSQSLVGKLAERFIKMIHEVDQEIGENRTYGAGIGPHDEDDQIDALVEAVRQRGLFDGQIATAKGDASEVRYPGGQSADIYLEADGQGELFEVKLFRFQKASGNPYAREFSKVFNPFQDRNPQSFVPMSRNSLSQKSAIKRRYSEYIIDRSTGLGQR